MAEAIKPGALKQKVKKGELTASEVLCWLEGREGPHSKKFVAWLRRRS